jgi:hypothetical protein
MRWVSAIGVTGVLFSAACKPVPRTLSPTETPWLGCYVLAWSSKEGPAADSLQVLLGTPTRLSLPPGFRPAWPNRHRDKTINIGDTAFDGPLWTARGDSLVLDSGFLSTQRITLWRRPEGLAGSVEVFYDGVNVHRDSVGRWIEEPHDFIYPATVQRVECPH